jgi:antitoxin CptB
MDAELKALRWRCRRGTRELDQLLGWWLEARYPHAPADLRTGFGGLLDAQDPDLWDWLLGRGQPDDANQARVIHEIRTRDRV